MSKPQNARFIRNPRKRSTNELIIVATEGAVTERDYIVALYQTFQKKARDSFKGTNYDNVKNAQTQ